MEGTTVSKFRYIAAAAIATAASLALAGCGSGGGGDAASKPAVSGNVTWWGWTPDTPVAQRYIAEFNKEFPKIKVTYKNFENVDFRNTLGPALDSGKGPDVFDLAPGGGSTDQWGGYALDLAPLATDTLGKDFASKVGTGYVKQLTTSGGKFVSAPLGGISAGFLWYNQDLFKQAGAEVPTDYNSWVATCKKIAAIGKTCFTVGAGGKDTFPTEMYHSIANSVDPSFFLKAATGKAKWSDPQGVEILQIIKKMRADGIISANALDGPQYPLANEAFMKEDAAIVQMGFWYTQYSGAESCKTAMAGAGVANPTCFTQLPMDFPDVAGKGNGSPWFAEADYGLAINSDSKNIAASKTFVKWMSMTKTGQQNVANAIDVLPALKGVTPDWNAIKLVNPDVQRPAIENLIKKSSEATQSRQWQTTQKTLDAQVIAIQQVLDPSANKSIQDIVNDQQASSEVSTVGAK
jgi:raffinose/stachyose/melibiose transport system substrate-binding protein